MEIYLINKETKIIINKYRNIVAWGINFVEFNNGGRCKIYCNEEYEYFTDKEPLEEDKEE